MASESIVPSPLPTYVYKILPSAPPTPLPSEYPLSELDRKDGFVHLSSATQVCIYLHVVTYVPPVQSQTLRATSIQCTSISVTCPIPLGFFPSFFFSSYFCYALHVLPITHYQLPTYLLTVGSDDRRPLLRQCHFHLALEAEARPLREGHEVGGPAWLRPPVRELWRGRGGELQGVLAGRGRDVECGFREAGWVVG